MDDAVIGSVIAGHRLDAVAGRGGMGVVYRATDLALDRTVAVKLITPALAGDPGFRRRFVAESKVAASIDHPNVIPIHHAGEHDGVLFQAMRYVDGEDLRSVLKREGRIAPDRAARIVAQVASALDAAHARGLVHRDVKPANVLLAAGDHVYLTDFGLSKRLGAEAEDASTPGEVIGTTSYISPEQIRGEPVDARTDVYALGAMLFHILTGRVPFPLASQEGRLWAHLSEPPPAASAVCPEVPSAFDPLIARAMSKAPADRHSSAGELAGVALVAASGAPPAPPSPEEVPSRRPLILRALRDPFSLAVAAPILVAGLLLGNLVLAAAFAIVVYAAGAVRAYLDEDVREAVAAKTQPPPAPAVSDGIQRLLLDAARIHQRIQAAIARADLPYAEVSAEVDRLLASMHEAAGRAQLLHDGLADAPPAEVAARLEAVKAQGDPAKADLVEALTSQLAVQRRMELQLKGFYDGMERTLVELDTVRGNLISVTAVPMADHQTLVAGEVRELRDDMDAVAEGVAAAYADQGDTTAVRGVG